MKTVEIPEGVTVTINDNVVNVNGPNGQLSRKLDNPKIRIEVKDGEVELSTEFPRKAEYALLGTFHAHINNMVVGVTKGFQYEMKIVYNHFPLKVSIKDRNVVIDNFLGEKHPRIAKIVGDTKVANKGDEVTVTGPDKEDVGQTAANIESATKIKGYDPRVFQDGIYITKKGVAE